MIRDRTNLFISYRQSYTHHPYLPESTPIPRNEEDESLLAGGGEAIEMETLPPTYLDLSSQLDQALDSIRDKMAQLAPLHKQNALPGFDDRSGVEREIEKLTVIITKGLHRCQALVKEFGELTATNRDKASRRMAENIKVAMATKLRDVSTTFRQMQSSYLRSLQRDQPLNTPGLVLGNVEDDVAYSHAALEQQQTMHEIDDTQVTQREREIERIAQGILEVADIFKDLQTFVIDQGTLVDRIDYNIEAMNQHVQDADKQLLEGAAYQKRTQKCKVIFLLVLVIIAIVLYLLFRPSHHTVYVTPKPDGGSDGGSDGSTPALSP